MNATIALKQVEGRERYALTDVIDRLNQRFEQTIANNPNGFLDAFEQRFETHCVEIAQELNAKFAVENGELIFDWS